MTDHLIDPGLSDPNTAPPILISDADLQTERGRYRCEVWKVADGHQYALVREGNIESLVNAREIIDAAIQKAWPGSTKIEYWPTDTVDGAPAFAMPYPNTISVADLAQLGLPITSNLP